VARSSTKGSTINLMVVHNSLITRHRLTIMGLTISQSSMVLVVVIILQKTGHAISARNHFRRNRNSLITKRPIMGGKVLIKIVKMDLPIKMVKIRKVGIIETTIIMVSLMSRTLKEAKAGIIITTIATLVGSVAILITLTKPA